MSTLVVGWQPLGWQPFLQPIRKRKATPPEHEFLWPEGVETTPFQLDDAVRPVETPGSELAR